MQTASLHHNNRRCIFLLFLFTLSGEIGLAAPQVTYIMHDLKEKGLPVKVNVTTVEEAADEIMQALEKKI